MRIVTGAWYDTGVRVEFFNAIVFTRAWALVLLPAVWALVWVFRHRSPAFVLRGIAVTLAVFALAGLSLRTEPTRVAIVLDVSDSMGSAAVQAVNELAMPGLRNRLSYIAVGAQAVQIPEPRVPSTLDTSATALSEGISAAEATGAARILVVSDGVVPGPELAQQHPLVPVDVLPLTSVPDVGFAEIISSGTYTPGTSSELHAVVHSSEETTVTLRATIGNAPPTEHTLALKPGSNLATIPLGPNVASSDIVDVELQLSVPFSQPTQNDVARTSLLVTPSDRVLVIGDPALTELLTAHGIPAYAGTAEHIRLPLNHAAVVVRGSAEQFSRGQLSILADYVANGGGLMFTGGPESFGFGGWQRTELEALMPVDSDVQSNVLQPQVAMVMIIDRSNSMSAGRPSRMALAREGAMQVVELAYHRDLLGVIAFSDPQNTEWIFKPRPATDRGKREMLALINRLEPNGGTVLRPGFEMAIEELRNVDAAVRHIVILSDGQLYDGHTLYGGGGMPDFWAIAREAAEAGITTSTIALGETADFEQLSRIADGGRGRYYEALDAAGLPSIFTTEALQTNRALLVEEPQVPTWRPSQFGGSGAALGALQAYVATNAKPDAQVIFAAANDEAVLATRNVGLGRAAALTTDLNAWSGDFGNSAGFQEVLVAVTRWLQTEPTRYSAAAERRGNRVHVVLDAVQDGEFLLGEHLTGRFGSETFTLSERQPGRYEAEIAWPGSQPGDVVISLGNQVVARASVTGRDPEFAQVPGDEYLRDLAARTGGEEITNGATYDPELPRDSAELAPWLLGIIIALLLTEVAWRRFSPPVVRRRAFR